MLHYCSYDYQKKLQAYGLQPSMSGKGSCYDNASVETFFKSLKAELIWRQSWLTRRQAEAASTAFDQLSKAEAQKATQSESYDHSYDWSYLPKTLQ